MILGDFKVVGLTETTISIQQIVDEQQPQAGPMPRMGMTQTIPATVEQTTSLSITQLVTLTLEPKVTQ